MQAVDYRGLKESPESVSGPDADDIRRVLGQLPKGPQDWIREVRSPEDLQKLLTWITKDGKEMPGRCPDPSKGIWRDLPDGSKIGERFSAKSTGDASLDIDLNGEKWKVHINPQTGSEPNLPTLKAPPVEPAPAVKSTPPVAKVPVEGWGGPSAMPFGPQPIHPPGSIHHRFPILGEDNPAESPRDFEGH